MFGFACFGGTPRLGASAPPASIEEAIAAALAGSPELAELVGPNIHPDDRPSWVPLDALIYSVASETPDKSLDGSTGVRVARVEFEGHSLSRRSARQISEAAVALLLSIERQTIGGVFFSTVIHDQDSEAYVDQGNGNPCPYRWHSPELMVRYRLV